MLFERISVPVPSFLRLTVYAVLSEITPETVMFPLPVKINVLFTFIVFVTFPVSINVPDCDSIEYEPPVFVI